MRLFPMPLCLALLATQAHADEIREWRATFDAGKTYDTSKGWLNGNQSDRYIISARSGQELSIKFEPMSEACGLHVSTATSDEKIYDWSPTKKPFRTTIEKASDYIALIHIKQDAAETDGKCTYFIRFDLK
jgi:hypothetical protein